MTSLSGDHQHAMRFPENPFSADRLHPAQNEFIFDRGLNLEAIVRKFAEVKFRAQILGPHGSGKSTLLNCLKRELINRFSPVRHIRVFRNAPDHSKPFMPGELARRPRAHKPLANSKAAIRIELVTESFGRCEGDSRGLGELPCLLVDGFEQLPFLQRKLLIFHARIANVALIVTTHRDAGLKTLHETSYQFQTLKRLSHRLQQGCSNCLDEQDLRDAFTESAGNIRESLFCLFDRYRDRFIADRPDQNQLETGLTALTAPS